ncbi:Carbon monoxide dehydrogenase large chain [archaeon HR06]|nr:Carbon monoxide dehydrogenase large chain [archaeon HR06]
MKGVIAVFTGKDFSNYPPIPTAAGAGCKVPKRYPLAIDHVNYVGEPIAMVIAEDRYIAKDAVELINVDYEPLEVVVDPEKALDKKSPLVHDEFPDNVAYYQRTKGGDPDKAFKEADLIVKEKLVIQRLAPIPLETRGIVANYESSTGFLTIWMGTQAPHVMRTWYASYLGLPENKIRVIAPDVGGGFGCKVQFYSDEISTVIASIKLGRPIKWIEERRESLLTTNHGRDQIHYIELAVKKDGKVIGLRDKIIADYGAYLHLLTPASSQLTVAMITGCYDIKNIDVELYGVFTNKMSIDAYRGAGRPEATYVIERMIDEVARALKMDPAEVRIKNFIKPNQFPYKNAAGTVYDTGNYEENLRKALNLIGYEKLRKEQKEIFEKEGRLLGIGIATYVEICGFGPSKGMPENWGGYESAKIRVDPDGRVTVYTGTSAHGQGHDTPFAQIVADELGVN